jgi:hypothetical protein
VQEEERTQGIDARLGATLIPNSACADMFVSFRQLQQSA